VLFRPGVDVIPGSLLLNLLEVILPFEEYGKLRAGFVKFSVPGRKLI
jgi:hypothetical protein